MRKGVREGGREGGRGGEGERDKEGQILKMKVWVSNKHNNYCGSN